MSQFTEDAHIAAVFAEIGEGTRVLCDIGARYEGSNSAALIERGFKAVLIDASQDACHRLRHYFPKQTVIHRAVKPEDVNDVCPPDAWFLTIDVDSVDWWLWANLKHRPALVVIESNPIDGMFVAKAECAYRDPEGYGASVEALKWLAEAKGYDYLGRTAANCFFARRDLNCQYRLPHPPHHRGMACRRENNVFL